MRITADLGAEGQVTERTLLLTALNCSIAVLALTALIPSLYLEYRGGWRIIVLHPLYLLGGSFLLGLVASALTLQVLQWIGKRVEVQVLALVALILVTVGVALILKLSVLLALLAYGGLLRNLDRNRSLAAPDFGLIGQMFFLILFVLAGAKPRSRGRRERDRDRRPLSSRCALSARPAGVVRFSFRAAA